MIEVGHGRLQRQEVGECFCIVKCTAKRATVLYYYVWYDNSLLKLLIAASEEGSHSQ